jgi:hypothetical protein
MNDGLPSCQFLLLERRLKLAVRVIRIDDVAPRCIDSRGNGLRT